MGITTRGEAMNKKKKLDVKVRERLKRVNRQSKEGTMFSPEVLEAIKLADLFEDIKPEPYILPLDRLAGFTDENNTDKTENNDCF